MLAVCVAAGAGVVVGGATLPGWGAPVGAVVLVVTELGVVLAGTDVVGAVVVAGVVVVAALCAWAEAGIVMPRALSVVAPAAWALAGSSTASVHAAATIEVVRAWRAVRAWDAVRAWRKLRLGLTVMLSPC